MSKSQTESETAPPGKPLQMRGSTAVIAVAALVALLAGMGGFLLSSNFQDSAPAEAATEEGDNGSGIRPTDWLAAAPGRVEPKSGLVRVGAQLLGRVAEVTVGVNDKVEKGELLIRLDDEEARARLQAAEIEAASRKRERDAQTLASGRSELREAEDAVFDAERNLTNAQFVLEYELQAKRNGSGSERRVKEARDNLKKARDRLKRERSNYAVAQAKEDVPAPSRIESALQQARSNVAVAEAVLEKTRIRAPVDGTVLQLTAKEGEMVSPSPEQPLVVLGDMSVVRLKAEVDEHDVSSIKVGGKVIVKSNAYPDREFKGTVAELAPSLGPPRFALRGARRPTDVEVLEVTIDLQGDVPLLPGMRADAFFMK